MFALCCNGCILTEGGRTKTTLDKTLQANKKRAKAPDKNPRELRQTPCKDICMYACTTKNGGSEICDKV